MTQLLAWIRDRLVLPTLPLTVHEIPPVLVMDDAVAVIARMHKATHCVRSDCHATLCLRGAQEELLGLCLCLSVCVCLCVVTLT